MLNSCPANTIKALRLISTNTAMSAPTEPYTVLKVEKRLMKIPNPSISKTINNVDANAPGEKKRGRVSGDAPQKYSTQVLKRIIKSNVMRSPMAMRFILISALINPRSIRYPSNKCVKMISTIAATSRTTKISVSANAMSLIFQLGRLSCTNDKALKDLIREVVPLVA